jgi:uncharacterized membrane-anchored protein YitT (DUF2179 family)
MRNYLRTFHEWKQRPGVKKVFEFFGITIGLILTAAAIDIFLVPNRLAAGGVSGLATVLHYTIGLPVGLTMLVFNIFLLILGTKIFGRIYGVKTIYGAIGVSLLVDLLYPFLPRITGDAMLSAIYGGILSGIGMGIVFRYRGNTGGTDIVAQIIQRFTNIPVGKAFLFVDGMVILTAALTFGLKLALYGMLSLFVMAWVIDLVQEGISSEKVVYIISDRNEEIAAEIMSQLDRGVTFVSSRGAYTGKERELIFVVIERKQVEPLLEIVRALDPKSFVIIHDAREVIGYGFKPWSAR